MLHLIEKQESF